MKTSPQEVTNNRIQVEGAIISNPHLNKMGLWLRGGQEYPGCFSDLPARLLVSKNINHLKSVLKHKLYRCALVDLDTGRIVLHAPNYREMFDKVVNYEPPKPGPLGIPTNP